MTLETGGPFAVHRRKVSSLPTLDILEPGGFILCKLALPRVHGS